MDFQALLFSQDTQQHTSLRQANEFLTENGYPALGDLFSNDSFEIEHTLGCIFTLVKSLQQEQFQTQNLEERLLSTYQEIDQTSNFCDQQQQQNQKFESEIGRLQNSIKVMQNKYREERLKSIEEREDLRKELAKAQYKEQQFSNKAKQKEITFNKFQDQLRRIMQEKDVPIKNQKQSIQQIQQTGSSLSKQVNINIQGDTEFGYQISKGYEEIQKKLTTEIIDYKKCFESLQRELIYIDEQRSEIYNQIQENETRKKKVFKIKEDFLRLPYENIHKEAFKTFKQNIENVHEMLEFSSYDQEFIGQPERQLHQQLKEYKLQLYIQQNNLEVPVVEESSVPDQLPEVKQRQTQEDDHFTEEQLEQNISNNKGLVQEEKSIDVSLQQQENKNDHLLQQEKLIIEEIEKNSIKQLEVETQLQKQKQKEAEQIIEQTSQQQESKLQTSFDKKQSFEISDQIQKEQIEVKQAIEKDQTKEQVAVVNISKKVELEVDELVNGVDIIQENKLESKENKEKIEENIQEIAEVDLNEMEDSSIDELQEQTDLIQIQQTKQVAQEKKIPFFFEKLDKASNEEKIEYIQESPRFQQELIDKEQNQKKDVISKENSSEDSLTSQERSESIAEIEDSFEELKVTAESQKENLFKNQSNCFKNLQSQEGLQTNQDTQDKEKLIKQTTQPFKRIGEIFEQEQLPIQKQSSDQVIIKEAQIISLQEESNQRDNAQAFGQSKNSDKPPQERKRFTLQLQQLSLKLPEDSKEIPLLKKESTEEQKVKEEC